MARWGKVDYRQLQQVQKRLGQLQKTDFDHFCTQMAKELAARLLARTIKRTPVDTGTLRRGWTATPLQKYGMEYRIDLINPTEYAIYVEYGHRQTPGRYVPQIGKRLKKGWVPGKFMLTISVQEVERQMPALIEKKLYAKLKEVFE